MDRGGMNWKQALKKLDIRWAKGETEDEWHLTGVHSCGDYHTFCGVDNLVHRFPADEGEPMDTLVCPRCLFKLGKLISTMVHSKDDLEKLQANLISLQEHIRLREYVKSVRN
jgi:hypothetical protein